MLNDTYKNLNQRASVISEWGKTGGVLMMGYELYRQLANRKPRRKRSKLEPRQEERENKAERKILSGKRPVNIFFEDKIKTVTCHITVY